MPISLPGVRTVTVAAGPAIAAADSADPNESAPDPTEIIKLERDRFGYQTRGHVLGLFIASADGTTRRTDGQVTFRTWWRNAASGRWFGIDPRTMTHGDGQSSLDDVGEADLWIQVTALGGSGILETDVITFEVGTF